MKIEQIAIIFSIQILIGLVLASYLFRKKNTPLLLIFLYGASSLLGIATLFYYNSDEVTDIQHGDSISALLFCFAAVLGLIMLVMRKALGMKLPIWLPVSHCLLALSAYVYLWVFILAK